MEATGLEGQRLEEARDPLGDSSGCLPVTPPVPVYPLEAFLET